MFVQYNVFSQLINTAHRSSEIEALNFVIIIRASRLKKVMADNEMKSTTKEFATNDQANYYSGTTSITVNGKNAYELKGKFLDDLHKNVFSGTNGEDAFEHIEHFLKIVDPIDLPNDRPTDSDASSEAHKSHHKTWTRSNRLCLNFMRMTIANNIKSTLPGIENQNDKDFLKLVEEKFSFC
ncbi:hypothetical protein Tco_0070884 [Tanacetum coccineum]